MKAEQFVKKLAEVTPSSKSLLLAGRSPKFVERFIAAGVLIPRKKPLDLGDIHRSEDLIDLFNRWDPSAVTVGMIQFLDKPIVTRRGVQVAIEEEDLLLISQSGQVVVEEAGSEGQRLAEVAEGGNSFLNAMIVAADFFGKRATKTIVYDDFGAAKNAAKACATAAGGKHYLRFYLNFLGAEE